MKLITFSLWGTDLKYLKGALQNAKLAKTIYPDWICRFYVGKSVPYPFIYELKSYDNVQVVERPELGDWRGMFWRFEPASEPGVEAMISRDTDSRLSHREKAAVDEWLASDRGLHIMRDHPWHGYPVLGGMWGAKAGTIPKMKELIAAFNQENEYGTDYKFFAEAVAPYIDPENVMVHDPFFGGTGRNFPTKRNGLEFVGKVYDADDIPVEEHDQVLKAHIESDKNDVYIYHHLGLGDHIDCNAIARIYLNEYRYDKVHVFAKQRYSDMINFMFRDEPRINVITIPGEDEGAEITEVLKTQGAKRLVKIGHDSYPWGQEQNLNMGCAEIFYKLVGIEFNRRFDDFYFDREPLEEERLCKKLNPDNERYIFVHDDPARGFEIPEEKIKELAGDCKIIRNDMTENIFHFCKLFENAHQIHCMESSFRSLVETLDIKGELFFHNFREGASGFLGNSTKQPWKEIKW